mmetsp:Transcript_38243/g.74707  ORF Transcript_38243/g.74707 Transcript_38243/m.74707 type:complete len:221 (-) Transcript_38243:191-853(-)
MVPGVLWWNADAASSASSPSNEDCHSSLGTVGWWALHLTGLRTSLSSEPLRDSASRKDLSSGDLGLEHGSVSADSGSGASRGLGVVASLRSSCAGALRTSSSSCCWWSSSSSRLWKKSLVCEPLAKAPRSPPAGLEGSGLRGASLLRRELDEWRKARWAHVEPSAELQTTLLYITADDPRVASALPQSMGATAGAGDPCCCECDCEACVMSPPVSASLFE